MKKCAEEWWIRQQLIRTNNVGVGATAVKGAGGIGLNAPFDGSQKPVAIDGYISSVTFAPTVRGVRSGTLNVTGSEKAKAVLR
ncbi:MAG: hypothetical protein WA172_09530 [Terriglobales bacterium]